jgi:hypothetical protein
VFILARATGWGEEYIWRMAYARGLMYLHCHLLYQGCSTRWAAVLEDEAAAMDAKFNSLLNR